MLCRTDAGTQPRASRLVITGGLVGVIAVAALGFLAGRSSAPRPRPAAPVIAAATPTPSPSVSEPARVLRRADLLALARAAADDFASGTISAATVAADRHFELLLPFGCVGPGLDGPSGAGWTYDTEAQTLRLSVRPVVFSGSDWGLGEESPVEAEGFWIAQPWSSAEACPARADAARPSGLESVTLPGQTLAVAQFFTGEENRSSRRKGRALELAKRIPAAEFDGSRGFVLRIEGRIGQVPGGGAVRCIQPGGIDQQPACLVAARLDQVAVVNPASGETVARWQMGGAS